jgi:hypothetical protein
MENYLRFMDQCPQCNVKLKCGKCYQMFENDKCFSCSSKVCEGIECDMEANFRDTFKLAEKYPEILEENYGNRNIKKFYD